MKRAMKYTPAILLLLLAISVFYGLHEFEIVKRIQRDSKTYEENEHSIVPGRAQILTSASDNSPVLHPLRPPSSNNEHKAHLIALLTASSRHIHDQRLIYSRRQLERELGGILATVDAPEDTVSEIKAFLLERIAVSLDAQDLAKEQQLSHDATKMAIADAQKSVDDEMQAALTPDIYNSVHEMVKQYVAYSQIENSFEPDMSFAGVPLDNTQIKALAATLYNTYSATTNPDAPRLRLSIDSVTGLSGLDSKVLSTATAFLSPDQLGVLKIDLASNSNAMLRSRGISQ
jgi:hypothetical protein